MSMTVSAGEGRNGFNVCLVFMVGSELVVQPKGKFGSCEGGSCGPCGGELSFCCLDPISSGHRMSGLNETCVSEQGSNKTPRCCDGDSTRASLRS